VSSFFGKSSKNFEGQVLQRARDFYHGGGGERSSTRMAGYFKSGKKTLKENRRGLILSLELSRPTG